MPRTHSFAQAGAYPFRPDLALLQNRGQSSSRPRKRARKRATFSADVAGTGVGPTSETGAGRDGSRLATCARRDSRSVWVSAASSFSRASLASSRAIASRIDCSGDSIFTREELARAFPVWILAERSQLSEGIRR